MKHKLFSIGSLASYMVIDFATIALSIMASYKIYRVLELGKYVFYPKLSIIPLSLLISLGVVFILFLLGAYKNESSLLNVREIKSVAKGISLGFLLVAAVLVFAKVELSRYVRKTSLDELPQLFNVLKGDMSFVGPRPEMPFIVESYSEIHRERLKALPGITGLWQLSGDREKAIHENMDYDLYYFKNRSFFLDVAILLETLLFAFRGV